MAKKTSDEPEMKMYVCSGCNIKLFDIKHYFTGVDSIKCMWCTKYPKPKQEPKKEKEQK
jgi:hypothetical protein